MLAGLGGPAGHPQWMLSGPPPTIVILADDCQRVPTATRNVPRSPRGCHRPGARPGTSDGGRGSPRRGAFSCTACFLRGPGMSESNRSSCVRARADRARLRTRGSASGWGPCSTFLCVFFALPWGVHGGRGEGVPPVTLPGYQCCCGACSAALWRVVASVSASLVASPAYRAPVVEGVGAAERPRGDVVGFGAVGLQACVPCERDAAGGAGGLSGGAVAFEDGCSPALVSGGSGAARGHGGWGGGCWRGGGLWSPPPPGWLEGGVIWPGGVVRLALVGGGVVVGGRAVRGCGAGFLGDLREP